MAYVVAPANKLELVFSDNQGRTARTGYWVPSTVTSVSDALVVALATAIDAISTLYIKSVKLKVYAVPDAPGVAAAGPQDHAEEKALMIFEAKSGEYRTMIGAPGDAAGSIFGSDHETVDETNANVAAYIAAMIANGKNAQGDPILRFVRGYRMAPAGRKTHG